MHHVPLGHSRQAGLQLQPDDRRGGKAPRQQTGDDAAAGAQFDDRPTSVGRDEIGEQEGVKGEAVAVWVLVQGETPRPGDIRRLVFQSLSLAAR